MTGALMSLNRRELAVGVAISALLASRAQAQPQGGDSAFYASFNDQLSSQPVALQGDIRSFYEAIGWRPAWTPERWW